MVTRSTAAEGSPRTTEVSSRSARRNDKQASTDTGPQARDSYAPSQTNSPEKAKTSAALAAASATTTTPEVHKARPGSRNGSTSADKDGHTPSKAAKPDESVGEERSKKRRKVNHACVYCRRSHMTCDQNRPCSRCVKRDIGHLCHDEPREPRKTPTKQEGASKSPELYTSTEPILPTTQDASGTESGQTEEPPPPDSKLPPASSQIINNNQAVAYYNNNGWNNNLPPNDLHDMHGYHPNYMFNTSEVTNEYNLINDFLSTSLLDDGSLMGDLPPSMFTEPSFSNLMGPLSMANSMFPPGSQMNQIGPPTGNNSAGDEGFMAAASRASAATTKKAFSMDKAQEKYYMTAADPAEAKPDERMTKLLKAKHEAGLLKPFNYIEGYKRLHRYMEGHLEASSRQRILRQLQRFRPEFRKRVSELTDLELVGVEMWFEKKLMEYDRVFASMAIPACCWRRTGEIFRGNREMAELIKVPVEHLRDGKLSIHEMMVESSLVAYWEKFGSIAFDTSRKAVLTSCWLQTPESSLLSEAGGGDSNSDGGGGGGGGARVRQLKCSFSFTVQRDKYQIPTLIIGNFLPILSPKST